MSITCLIGPHQFLDSAFRMVGPKETTMNGYEYKMYSLYNRDEWDNLYHTATIYAIDKRDAWYTFVNLGVLNRSTPNAQYIILD